MTKINLGMRGPRSLKRLAALIGFAALMTAPVGAARPADLKVYSPYVNAGELGFEARGNVAFDKEDDRDGAENQHYEIEYSVNDTWHTALIGELERENTDDALVYEATAWENILQFMSEETDWLAAGLYLEYEVPDDSEASDKVELKVLLEKSFDPLTFRLNPILEKEIGEHAEGGLELGYAWQARWRLHRMIELGIEGFGSIGEINNTNSLDRQRHQIGPAIFGEFEFGEIGEIEYELGYQFGLTDEGSPDGAFKWLLEYAYKF